MSSIYETGEYLDATGRTWHAEDSPWKAAQILRLIRDHRLRPARVAEVGCGAGRILVELSRQEELRECRFEGYDVSPQAIALCDEGAPNCRFLCKDIVAGEEAAGDDGRFDLLLAIDVFEHVPDYMGFLERCRRKAEHKIYHIPLDISVSSALRDSLVRNRSGNGHLHYFTAASALATLRDTGHEVVDARYTDGAIALFGRHPSLRSAVANAPRWIFSKFSVPLSARLFGGYSLLVLAR